MNEAKLFNGGVPTAPDVKKLRDSFDSRMVVGGQTVTHEEIETVIDSKRGTSRYRSVISAWRKEIENFFKRKPVSVRGVGYQFPSGSTMLTGGVREIVGGVKKVAIGAADILAIPSQEMTKAESATAKNATFFAGKVQALFSESKKEIKLPSARERLPSLAAPQD